MQAARAAAKQDSSTLGGQFFFSFRFFSFDSFYFRTDYFYFDSCFNRTASLVPTNNFFDNDFCRRQFCGYSTTNILFVSSLRYDTNYITFATLSVLTNKMLINIYLFIMFLLTDFFYKFEYEFYISQLTRNNYLQCQTQQL